MQRDIGIRLGENIASTMSGSKLNKKEIMQKVKEAMQNEGWMPLLIANDRNQRHAIVHVTADMAFKCELMGQRRFKLEQINTLKNELRDILEYTIDKGKPTNIRNMQCISQTYTQSIAVNHSRLEDEYLQTP